MGEKKSVSINVRGGKLIVPTCSVNANGITVLEGPVDVTGYPASESDLARILERAYRRSGKPSRDSGMGDLLGAAGRAAGCKSYREFVRGLRVLDLVWTQGEILITAGIPEKAGAFSFSDPIGRMSTATTFEDLARTVIELLKDNEAVRAHPG